MNLKKKKRGWGGEGGCNYWPVLRLKLHTNINQVLAKVKVCFLFLFCFYKRNYVHWFIYTRGSLDKCIKNKNKTTNQNKTKKETSSAVNFTKNTFLFSLRDVEKETVKY